MRIGIVSAKWKAAWLLAAAFAAACAMLPASRDPVVPMTATASATAPDARHRIHVVRRASHTGIVVAAADVSGDAWPARKDFPDAEYFEVGWGDREFYQTPDAGVWLGLKALARAAPGVLHVVAFRAPLSATLGVSDVVTLHVTADGMRSLVARIADSHERDAAGRFVALGPSLYGIGRFYASRDAFHAMRTCNVWTAEVLATAGIAVSPVLTAGSLMSQLRRRANALPGSG